jgi:hypothetical protein
MMIQGQMELALEVVRDLHGERLADSWLPPVSSLPELPESEAFEVYERVLEAEQRLVSPHHLIGDYRLGTAGFDDELFVAQGKRLLLSAEHATDQVRTRKKTGKPFAKEADQGTAGLACVLHEDIGATVVIPLGRQTADANNDTEHALKDELTDQARAGAVEVHASLHGARTGLYQAFADERGLDVHLGIGGNPNEATVKQAERLTKVAQNFGLKIVTNGKFIVNDSFEPLTPRLNENGRPVLRSFAAKNPATTRAHVQNVAEQQGLCLATLQVELSGFLRLLPKDIEPRDRVARAMGVYLGYRVMHDGLKELTNC